MQRSPRQIVKLVGVLAILIGGGFYIYSQLDTLLAGPEIAIEHPASYSSTVTERELTVRGTAQNITELTLNDNPILINQYSEFSELLLLAEGFNMLEVTAADRFGNTETATRVVIYEPSEPTPVPTTTPPVEPLATTTDEL